MELQHGDTFKATITDVWQPEGSRKMARARFGEFEYVFIIGTIGAPKSPEVGQTGKVTYRVGPSSGLWYWEDR